MSDPKLESWISKIMWKKELVDETDKGKKKISKISLKHGDNGDKYKDINFIDYDTFKDRFKKEFKIKNKNNKNKENYEPITSILNIDKKNFNKYLEDYVVNKLKKFIDNNIININEEVKEVNFGIPTYKSIFASSIDLDYFNKAVNNNVDYVINDNKKFSNLIFYNIKITLIELLNEKLKEYNDNYLNLLKNINSKLNAKIKPFIDNIFSEEYKNKFFIFIENSIIKSNIISYINIILNEIKIDKKEYKDGIKKNKDGIETKIINIIHIYKSVYSAFENINDYILNNIDNIILDNNYNIENIENIKNIRTEIIDNFFLKFFNLNELNEINEISNYDVNFNKKIMKIIKKDDEMFIELLTGENKRYNLKSETKTINISNIKELDKTIDIILEQKNWYTNILNIINNNKISVSVINDELNELNSKFKDRLNSFKEDSNYEKSRKNKDADAKRKIKNTIDMDALIKYKREAIQYRVEEAAAAKKVEEEAKAAAEEAAAAAKKAEEEAKAAAEEAAAAAKKAEEEAKAKAAAEEAAAAAKKAEEEAKAKAAAEEAAEAAKKAEEEAAARRREEEEAAERRMAEEKLNKINNQIKLMDYRIRKMLNQETDKLKEEKFRKNNNTYVKELIKNLGAKEEIEKAEKEIEIAINAIKEAEEAIIEAEEAEKAIKKDNENEEIKKAKNEKEEAEKEIEIAKEEIEIAKEKENNKNEKIEKAKKEKEKAEKEIDEAQDNVNEAISNAQHKISNAQKIIIMIRGKIEPQKNLGEANDAIQQVEEANTAIQQAEEAIEKAKANAEEKTMELRNEAEKQAANEAKDKVQVAKQAANNAKNKAQVAKETAKIERARLENLQQEQVKAATKIQAIVRGYSNRKKLKAKKEKEIEIAKKEIEIAKKEVQEAENEIEIAKNAIKEAEEAIIEAEEAEKAIKKDNENEEIKKAKNEKEEAEKEIEIANNAIQQAEKATQEAEKATQEAANKAKDKAQVAKQAANEAKDKAQVAKQAANEAKDKAQVAKQAANNAKNKAQVAKKAAEIERARLENLQQEQVKAATKIQAIVRGYSNRKKLKAKKEKEIEIAKKEIEIAKKEVQEAENEIEIAKNAIKEAEEAIIEAEEAEKAIKKDNENEEIKKAKNEKEEAEKEIEIANNAIQQAEKATQEAEKATQEAANKAKDKAQVAKQAANEAKDKAQVAKQAANNAKNKAQVAKKAAEIERARLENLQQEQVKAATKIQAIVRVYSNKKNMQAKKEAAAAKKAEEEAAEKERAEEAAAAAKKKADEEAAEKEAVEKERAAEAAAAEAAAAAKKKADEEAAEKEAVEKERAEEKKRQNEEAEKKKKSIQRKILSYIFEYDDEKIIKKRIKLLNAKYKLELKDDVLKLITSYSDIAKGTLDTQQRETHSTKNIDITTRDVNTFVDFLAKYKFSYNHSDMDGDKNKLIKLYNKVGINIDETIAESMLKSYFPNGKLEKSKLEYLYKKDDDNSVKSSNESENLRAFNIFLKSLDNKNIDDIIYKVYEGSSPDEKTKDKFKQLFSDSNGKFKISSISKLF
jgi:hypothetical protein